MGAFFDRRLHPGPRRSRLTRNRNRQGKREEIVRGEAARLETLVTIMVWALKSQNEDQPDCSLSRLPLPVCGRGFVLLCCCRRQPGGRDWTTSSFAGSRSGVAVVDLTPVPGRRRDKGDDDQARHTPSEKGIATLGKASPVGQWSTHLQETSNDASLGPGSESCRSLPVSCLLCCPQCPESSRTARPGAELPAVSLSVLAVSASPLRTTGQFINGGWLTKRFGCSAR